jgi:hypothetical protein
MLDAIDTAIIEEGLSYGLDIEAERCEISLLREDVLALRDMDETQRAAAVSRLNDGVPLSWPA